MAKRFPSSYEDSSTESDDDSDEEDSEQLVDEWEEDIGSKRNEWVFPVNEWGKNDAGWKKKFEKRFGKVNFSKRRWNVSCSVADFVLKELIERSRNVFERDNLRLELKKYMYQGSSREGLKVDEPDEYDTIMLFKIQGLSLRVKRFKDNHMLIPEVGKVIVEDSISMKTIKRDYRVLYDKGVFYEDDDDDDEICIDAYRLMKVFESIFKKAIKTIKDGQRIDRNTKIDDKIYIEKNKPSINFDIEYSYKKDDRNVNIDVVPAIVVKNDLIELPGYCKRGYENRESVIKCPVYAVLKRIKKKKDPVMRICYSGYEKHFFDEARNLKMGQMILTAHCVMKYLNTLPGRNDFGPFCGNKVSIVKSYSSYQLKNIMFYVLMFLLMKHPEIEINGVLDVVPYFVILLEESLRYEKLPHYFYSCSMSPLSKKSKRYNLFERITSSKHALKKFCTDLRQLIGMGKLTKKMACVKKEYVKEITHGTYIDRKGLRHAIRKQDCVSVTRKSEVRKQFFKL